MTRPWIIVRPLSTITTSPTLMRVKGEGVLDPHHKVVMTFFPHLEDFDGIGSSWMSGFISEVSDDI